ncbi:MAG: response regulator [Desulfobacterales bacterium]|jgi:CheY-like chemotaxis protein|nr:response regulator [Desulfobacterales bacterium]
MAKTIVFVDDDLDMRIFLSTVLKTSGYAPVPARNAVEGMQKVRESSPDLVIMDVMMPKAGGVTMFRELKSDERLKHIPVIMLTGVSEKAFAHHVRMVNLRIDEHLPPPDAYLEKPLNPEVLLAAIQRLLPKTE